MCKLELHKVSATTAPHLVQPAGADKGWGAQSSDISSGQLQQCTRSCVAPRRADLSTHMTMPWSSKPPTNQTCVKRCGHERETRASAETCAVKWTAPCGYSNYSEDQQHPCTASVQIQEPEHPDQRSQQCADLDLVAGLIIWALWPVTQPACHGAVCVDVPRLSWPDP